MLDWILNGVVLLVCFVAAFYFLKKRDEDAAKKEREKALAAAAKEKEEVIEKPYSLKELREYDGSDENKPILLAVNYKVFNVTKGKDFYGKGDKLYLTSLNNNCTILALTVYGKCNYRLLRPGELDYLFLIYTRINPTLPLLKFNFLLHEIIIYIAF